MIVLVTFQVDSPGTVLISTLLDILALDILGLDILGLDILGLDILGLDILGLDILGRFLHHLQHLAPIHATCGYNRYLLAYSRILYSSARGILCICIFLVTSEAAIIPKICYQGPTIYCMAPRKCVELIVGKSKRSNVATLFSPIFSVPNQGRCQRSE